MWREFESPTAHHEPRSVTPGFVPADLAPTRNFVLTATGTEGVGDAACGATPVMKGSRPRGAARLALSRIGESRRADRGYSSVTTYPPEGRLREGMGKPWSANSLAAARRRCGPWPH